MIWMVGVDHTKAKLSLRELAAFTEAESRRLLTKWNDRQEVLGGCLLATCNRTELYVHTKSSVDAKGLFLDGLRAVGRTEEECEALANCLCVRQGEEALRYLMEVACGFHSQIFGEDQILAQVKCALALAEEEQSVDAILRRMVQTAITAAKRVKTACTFGQNGKGLALAMVHTLQSRRSLAGANALVIGNGEMGRAAAEALSHAGVSVTVTVRHYKTREVIIPVGCRAVDYCERYALLPQADVVVSATRSPHRTLDWQPLCEAVPHPERLLWVDLAVPRDLPAELSAVCPQQVYDTDRLGQLPSDGNEAVLLQAQEILAEEAAEYLAWRRRRRSAVRIHAIAQKAAEDVLKRLEKPLAGQSDELREAIFQAAWKSVSAALFEADEEEQG